MSRSAGFQSNIAKKSRMYIPTSSLLSKQEKHTDRPVSVPPTPDGSTRLSPMFARLQNEARSSSIPPRLTQRHAHSDSSRSGSGRPSSRASSWDRGDSGSSLDTDMMTVLHRSEPSVVKTRSGSVLSRGMILKTDHYPSGMPLFLVLYRLIQVSGTPGRALDLELNVHGAPNFRSSRQGGLNVFGAAQPRTQGLRAILSILRARPNNSNPAHVVWFSTREEPIGIQLLLHFKFIEYQLIFLLVYISGRPFVLRDASEPRRTLPLSDRAENLEAIEARLKNDILAESIRYHGLNQIVIRHFSNVHFFRYGGVLLTHNEIGKSAGLLS